MKQDKYLLLYRIIIQMRVKQNGNNQRSKGKHFKFTHCDTVLPRLHNSTEFSQIIQSKRVYQSMIKEQLSKLDKYEADPQIQPFCLSWKQQVEEPLHANTKTQVEIKELTSQIQSAVKKKGGKQLLLRLDRLRSNNKNSNAAIYYHYDRTIRKCFGIWKEDWRKISLEQQEWPEQQLQKIMKINRAIKSSMLKRMMVSVFGEKLRKRVKILRKIREYRWKKDGLKKLRQFYANQTRFRDHVLSIRNHLQRAALAEVLHRHRSKKRVKDQVSKLQSAHKHRLLLVLINSSKQIIKMQAIQHKVSKSLFPFQADKQALMIKQQLVSSLQQNSEGIGLQQQTIISQQILEKCLFFKEAKQFFSHFRLIYFLKSREQMVSMMREDRGRKQCWAFFMEMKRKHLEIRNERILKMCYYFNNFKCNSSEDRQYRISIEKCLRASKEWMARNQQGLFDTAANTKANLLPQKSRFRKVRNRQMMKQFVYGLRDRHLQQKRIKFTGEILKTMLTSNTIKSMLASWRDQVFRIKNEANIQGQQILEEQNFAKLQSGQVLQQQQTRASMLKATLQSQYKRHFLMTLKHLKQHHKRQRLLQSLHLRTSVSYLQRNIRLNQEVKTAKNSVIKMKLLSHWRRFAELLRQQIRVKGKYENRVSIGSIQKYLSQTVMEHRIESAIMLLRTCNFINKLSIKVTSLYLKNCFVSMLAICKKDREVRQQLAELMSYRLRMGYSRLQSSVSSVLAFNRKKKQCAYKLQSMRSNVKRWSMEIIMRLMGFSMKKKKIAQKKQELDGLIMRSRWRRGIQAFLDARQTFLDARQINELKLLQAINDEVSDDSLFDMDNAENFKSPSRVGDYSTAEGRNMAAQLEQFKINAVHFYGPTPTSNEQASYTHTSYEQTPSSNEQASYTPTSNEQVPRTPTSNEYTPPSNEQTPLFNEQASYTHTSNEQASHTPPSNEQASYTYISNEQTPLFNQQTPTSNEHTPTSNGDMNEHTNEHRNEQFEDSNHSDSISPNRNFKASQESPQQDCLYNKSTFYNKYIREQFREQFHEQFPEQQKKYSTPQVKQQEGEQNQQQNDKFDFNINREPAHVIGESQSSSSQQQPYIDQAYLSHRYETALMRRCLLRWKLCQHQQQQQNHDNYEAMKKCFSALHLHSRQKVALRQYLKQYEQELAYFPKSQQQLQQFHRIAALEG